MNNKRKINLKKAVWKNVDDNKNILRKEYCNELVTCEYRYSWWKNCRNESDERSAEAL